MSWLPDEVAARLWGERYRSGTRDVEELKYDLEVIASLDLAEAETCLRWFRSQSPSDSECLERLEEIIRTGQRVHALAAATASERSRQVKGLRQLPDDPLWHESAWVALLAEARVDPHHAAELALEFWCQRGASNPAGEWEILRRLWLLDPDAALSFFDRQQRPSTSVLKILLQRALAAPSPENRRLALEWLARLDRGSWAELCVAVVRVLRTVERWEPADQLILLEATVRAVEQFNPDTDWERSRHAAFKGELASQLPILPNLDGTAGTLAALLTG